MKLGVLRSSDYVYDSRMNTVDEQKKRLADVWHSLQQNMMQPSTSRQSTENVHACKWTLFQIFIVSLLWISLFAYNDRTIRHYKNHKTLNQYRVKRNINNVKSVQRNAARFTCLSWFPTDIWRGSHAEEAAVGFTPTTTSRAASAVMFTKPEMVASPYLEPVPIWTRRFETRHVHIRCNAGTHSQTFFPSATWLWNTLPVDIAIASYPRAVSRPISGSQHGKFGV